MIINARYESQCTLCDELIKEGDKINWESGELSASHVICPEGAVEKKWARDRFVSIGSSMMKSDNMPSGIHTPEGEMVISIRICSTHHWCYIGADWIWYIHNYDWGIINVRDKWQGTGWRVAYNEELAQKLRDIANIFNKVNDDVPKKSRKKSS